MENTNWKKKVGGFKNYEEFLQENKEHMLVVNQISLENLLAGMISVEKEIDGQNFKFIKSLKSAITSLLFTRVETGTLEMEQLMAMGVELLVDKMFDDLKFEVSKAMEEKSKEVSDITKLGNELLELDDKAIKTLRNIINLSIGLEKDLEKLNLRKGAK